MAERIAVLGAGTMGSGIAQLAAQSGFDVLLYDVQDELVQRGIKNIRANLQARVERGKLPREEMEAALARISTTTHRDDTASASAIIEAAPEDFAMKREIFASLDSLSAPETILATNTSSLSVTGIASAAGRPERVVGLHFFNPAPAMQLVEIVPGSRTSHDTTQRATELARAMGKIPVLSADTPGFIVNRVARPFYGEALKMLGEGAAGIAQVDEAMRAAGFRMGPFELMDLIGIDINFAVTKSVHEASFGEPRFRPHLIQQRMVESGTLGRKSGRGFYDYAGGERGEPTLTQMASHLQKRTGTFIPPELVEQFLAKGEIQLEPNSDVSGEVITRVLAMIMNEAAFAMGEGVASVRDIDKAMVLGTNYPKGPLQWADQIGLDVVFAVLKSLQESLGEDRYRPAPLLWHMVKSATTGDGMGEGFHTPGEKGMV